MVQHPKDYPWTSYHHNALYLPNSLISPHEVYLKLGKTKRENAEHYSTLFEKHIPQSKIDEIRSALNRAWVLGSNEFKVEIERKTGVPIIFNSWGGARHVGDDSPMYFF